MKIEHEKYLLSDHTTKIVFNGELIVGNGVSRSDSTTITASIAGGETKKAEIQVGEKIIIKTGTTIYEIFYSHQTFWGKAGIIVCKIDGNELWDNIISGDSKKPFEFDDTDNNEPFSKEEKENIKKSMNNLHKTVISKFGKQKAEEKIINDKLDYILETLNRQGKKDWMHTSIGVFATLASSLCLSGEQATIFWQTIKDFFGVPIKLLIGK